MKKRRWAALATCVCLLAGVWGFSGSYAAHPPRLSSMPEARCMGILEAYGVEMPEVPGDIVGTVRMVEFNPNCYKSMTYANAPKLLEQLSSAVCEYYGWVLPPDKTPLYSLSEEECIRILTEYGVEIPEDNPFDILEAVRTAEENPFSYYAVSSIVAVKFGQQMSRAVSRYYGWFWEYDDGMGWVDEV